MDWINLNSTSLARVKYEPSSLILEIEFHGGRVYQYFDVPSQIFEGLIGADSHGEFFNSQIKGHYRYARV